MPQLTVSDATYQQLAERAAKASLTVDALVAPALDALARGESARLPPGGLPYEEWKRRFDEWQGAVQRRAERYPPGFRVDDDREGFYKEREDAQL